MTIIKHQSYKKIDCISLVELYRNIRFSNSYIDSINKILDKYVLMLK